MVFLPKGTKTYKVRVDAPSGRYATLSTECTLLSDAQDVERVVREWQGKSPKGRAGARAELLELLTAPVPKTVKGQAKVAREITLADAYQMHLADTLDAWFEERAKTADERAAAASDIDLHPHITLWRMEKIKSKKGAASVPKYEKQLRTLFPSDRPFTRSLFTRKTISERLDALEVDAPTKNRYKVAVNSFAKYLVKHEIIDTNVVRDVEGYGENTPRCVYYERPQAQKLIELLPADDHVQGIAAFAAAFCAEWSGIENATAADLDLTKGHERAFVKGGKRPWRKRWVPLVDENRWLLPYLKKVAAGKVGDALLFPGAREWIVLDAQRLVATDRKIHAKGESDFSQHGIHDWRHTHIVQLLRDGYSEQIAASHAGHKNTDLVRKTYGVFIPTKDDYARPKLILERTPVKRARRA